MNIVEFRKRIHNGENIRDILMKADEATRSNKEIMHNAILEWRGAFQYASDELKGDKTFVIEYLEGNCSNFPLQYCSYEIRTDTDFLLQIAKIDPITLVGADRSVLDSKEFMRKVVEISYIPFGYSKLASDEEFVNEIVGINGLTLVMADEKFWENRELLLKAAKNNGEILNLLPIDENYLSQYLEDEELLIEASKSIILRNGSNRFQFDYLLSEEMQRKLSENKELEDCYQNWLQRRREELRAQKDKKLALVQEEQTILQAEKLLDAKENQTPSIEG